MRCHPLNERAEEAWQAHRALMLAERADPSLKTNPVWKCLRMDAYETLYREMSPK